MDGWDINKMIDKLESIKANVAATAKVEIPNKNKQAMISKWNSAELMHCKHCEDCSSCSIFMHNTKDIK